MIISNKQILELISIAYQYSSLVASSPLIDNHQKIKVCADVGDLIQKINNQQSEKLKVIE